MTPGAREQIKADCAHDEAKGRTECFLDNNPGTILVDTVWLCEEHGRCATCAVSLAGRQPCFCGCEDYGTWGHEDRTWCSLDCLDSAHPAPSDREPAEDE